MAARGGKGRLRRLWTSAWCGAWTPWLVVLVLLFAAQVKPWWTPTRDGAAYLSIARNLANGELAQQGSAHVTYPIGYPALIAPAFLTGNRPFLAIALVHLACIVAAAIGIHRWLRGRGLRAAPVLTALALVNVSLWAFYRATLSETAFLAAFVWAALFADAGLAHPRRRRAWIAAVLLAAAAVLLRSAAITLAGGVALAWLLATPAANGGRRRALPGALAVGLAAVAAFAFLVLVDRATAARAGTETGGYLHLVDRPESTLLAQLAEAVRLRTAEIGRLLLPGMHKAYARAGEWIHPATLVYLLFALGIAWGWVRAMGRGAGVLVATLPFYVLLYVIWPFDQGTRYVAPMLPVLVLCLWEGLGTRPVRRWRRPVVAFLLVAHLGVALGGFARDRDLARFDADWPRVEAIAAALPPGQRDRVATVGLGLEPTVMLQVALDRPVRQLRPGADLGDASWILTPAGAEPPGALDAHGTFGDWWLHPR